MELFIPDAFLYVSFAIMTAFFAHAAIKLATFQTLHKHVFTRSCWLFSRDISGIKLTDRFFFACSYLIYSLWNGNVYCFLLYCAVYLPEERILV